MEKLIDKIAEIENEVNSLGGVLVGVCKAINSISSRSKKLLN